MLAANIPHRDAETIPQRLRDYLSKAGRCTVCSKPFLETLFTCTYFIEARCVSLIATTGYRLHPLSSNV